MDNVTEYILRGFKHALNDIAKEEIERAKDRVEKRISDEVALIGLNLHRQVSVDLNQDRSVISVKKDFKNEA
jgi:hypothetical protein